MVSDLGGIPEFLKLTPEERRAAWDGRPLTIAQADTMSSDQRFRRDMDALYARAIEEAAHE